MSLLAKAKDAFFHPQYGWKTTHFWGPVANWGIVLSAVYDASTKGPETIDPTTTAVLMTYSTVFTRFALKVQPVNYLLFACHTFNVAAQSFQLYRWSQYHSEKTKIALNLPTKERDELLQKIGPGLPLDKIGIALATVLTSLLVGQKVLKPALTKYTPTVGSFMDKTKQTLMHPAGPFYVHFWGPIFKWTLSVNNILAWDRDINQISLPQQTALAATGFIWSRYSLVITPKNWSLFLVNFVLGLTGAYHVGRKIKHQMSQDKHQV